MSEDMRGLSPRVRGNLCWTSRTWTHKGSIPACAGEPDTMRSRSSELGVYPRVCGGTTWAGTADGRSDGLSPRVRGNPLAFQ